MRVRAEWEMKGVRGMRGMGDKTGGEDGVRKGYERGDKDEGGKGTRQG